MEHLNLHSNFPLLQRRSWFEKLIWCKRFLETSSSSSKSNEDFPSRVLPIMVFAYMLAFLDKQALGYTALMGIREDLHLVGSQYNWSSSIFYFGYLFFSWGVLILAQRSALLLTMDQISRISFDGQIPAREISCYQFVRYTMLHHFIDSLSDMIEACFGPSSWLAMLHAQTSRGLW